MWLHADCAWGGAVIFSPKHRHLMHGAEMCDSIAYNPHKMIGAPLQASLILTRHKGLLHQTNCAASTYLFQQDKFYDVSSGRYFIQFCWLIFPTDLVWLIEYCTTIKYYYIFQILEISPFNVEEKQMLSKYGLC